MPKHDNYEYWKAYRAHAKDTSKPKPEPSTELYPLGFFKQGDGTPLAIWKDPENLEEVIIRVGIKAKNHQMKSTTAEGRLEYGGFGEPVGEADYLSTFESGTWPWNEPAVPGGATPPVDGSPEDYEARIADLEAKIAEAIKAPLATKTAADSVQNLRDQVTKLKGAVIDRHKEEKAPHLEAGRQVDGTWFPLRDRAEDAAKKASRAVTIYLEKAQEEANRRAREEEEKLRKEHEDRAAKDPETAKEPPPTVEPERVRVGNTRRTGLKKEKVAKVVDLHKALNAVMASQSNSWKEALGDTMQKIANAAMRAGIELDGVEFTEETKAS